MCHWQFPGGTGATGKPHSSYTFYLFSSSISKRPWFPVMRIYKSSINEQNIKDEKKKKRRKRKRKDDEGGCNDSSRPLMLEFKMGAPSDRDHHNQLHDIVFKLQGPFFPRERSHLVSSLFLSLLMLPSSLESWKTRLLHNRFCFTSSLKFLMVSFFAKFIWRHETVVSHLLRQFLEANLCKRFDKKNPYGKRSRKVFWKLKYFLSGAVLKNFFCLFLDMMRECSKCFKQFLLGFWCLFLFDSKVCLMINTNSNTKPNFFYIWELENKGMQSWFGVKLYHVRNWL